jgi:hypothetical protein
LKGLNSLAEIENRAAEGVPARFCPLEEDLTVDTVEEVRFIGKPFHTRLWLSKPVKDFNRVFPLFESFGAGEEGIEDVVDVSAVIPRGGGKEQIVTAAPRFGIAIAQF